MERSTADGKLQKDLATPSRIHKKESAINFHFLFCRSVFFFLTGNFNTESLQQSGLWAGCNIYRRGGLDGDPESDNDIGQQEEELDDDLGSLMGGGADPPNSKGDEDQRLPVDPPTIADGAGRDSGH
jgi:hypothetical protein